MASNLVTAVRPPLVSVASVAGTREAAPEPDGLLKRKPPKQVKWPFFQVVGQVLL